MFSVGVLYSAQEFLDFVEQNHSIDLKFPEIFRTFSVASSKAVLEVSQKCEWVCLNTSGYLEITDRGRQVLQGRQPDIVLRVQMGHLIETYLPTWLPLLNRGREEARKYLPLDAAQCMREAGLFTGTSDEIVKWWDTYSKLSRRSLKDSRLDVGRQGERLSLQHERQRTKREPVWRGFESNLSGFDILSIVAENDGRPLRIEVKTSNSTLSTAVFFLSRNEWQVASVSDNYLFHLWSLQPKPTLMLIEVEQIEQHIPIDRGQGTWKTVCIPHSAFKA
jgi:hypothetical protein